MASDMEQLRSLFAGLPLELKREIYYLTLTMGRSLKVLPGNGRFAYSAGYWCLHDDAKDNDSCTDADEMKSVLEFFGATLSEAEYHDAHAYLWSRNKITTNSRAGTESLARRIDELNEWGYNPKIRHLEIIVPSDFGPTERDEYDSEDKDVIACPYFADPEDYEDDEPSPKFPGLRGIRMLLPLAKVQLHVQHLELTFETWGMADSNESIFNNGDGANPDFIFRTGIILAKLREVLLANCSSAVLRVSSDSLGPIPQDGTYGGADCTGFHPAPWEPLSEEDLSFLEKEREMYKLKSELKGYPKKKKTSKALREKRARVNTLEEELYDWDNDCEMDVLVRQHMLQTASDPDWEKKLEVYIHGAPIPKAESL